MHRFLASSAAAAAVGLAILASPASAQGRGETVKFQDYPGLGNMLVKVAIAKGYCEQAGIRCELQSIPAAPLGMQAMLARSIDSALGPAEVMNGAVLRGAKMRMVVGGAVTNVNTLIVGNHLETPNAGKGWPAFMQDLRGRKVGVTSRGANTEVTTRWLAAKAGIDPEQITFVAVGGPNTAYGALVSRQVDALMIFEPAGAMCEVLKTCRVLWRAATDRQPAEQFALNGGGNGLIFTQEYIDRNPHVIDAVIRAVRQADAFINAPANFAEVSRIAQQFFRFDMPRGDEVLERALRIAIDTGAYRSTIDRKALQAGLDLMVETKQVDKAVPVSELVLDRAP